MRGELTMTLELPNMIYMNTNLDKLLKKISQLESGEQVSLSFKNIEFILPESTILLLSISKQIYDRTHTVVTWLDVKNDMRMYLERIQINKLACKWKVNRELRKFAKKFYAAFKYYKKTTVKRWPIGYWVKVILVWVRQLNTPSHGHSRFAGTYWHRQSCRHSTASLLNVSCPESDKQRHRKERT